MDPMDPPLDPPLDCQLSLSILQHHGATKRLDQQPKGKKRAPLTPDSSNLGRESIPHMTVLYKYT